jgi:hypothetical protein
MAIALWIGGVFLLGAFLVSWLLWTLQNIERQPWW